MSTFGIPSDNEDYDKGIVKSDSRATKVYGPDLVSHLELIQRVGDHGVGGAKTARVIRILILGASLAAVVTIMACKHYPIPGVDQHEHPPGRAGDLTNNAYGQDRP